MKEYPVNIKLPSGKTITAKTERMSGKSFRRRQAKANKLLKWLREKKA
jgi:hypothetical protein